MLYSSTVKFIEIVDGDWFKLYFKAVYFRDRQKKKYAHFCLWLVLVSSE